MATEKRLIDAYKLEDLVRSNSARYHHTDDIIAAIAGQPTVDAMEVVHGRWETYCGGLRKCTACGYEYTDYLECKDYCGNCGAKMDGGGSR